MYFNQQVLLKMEGRNNYDITSGNRRWLYDRKASHFR